MSGRCLTCQLCLAGCRILCYQFCCCCLHEKKVPKTEINVLMLGLQNAGKSHLLAMLCNESTSSVVATDGFSMKDISLRESILHVKELGGSPKIIPYWNHYMDNRQQGIIFVVDGKTLEKKEICDQNCATLRKIFENDGLIRDIPLLVLITKLEQCATEDSVDEITAILDLKEICGERPFNIDFVHDIEQTKSALELFVISIIGPVSEEVE